MDDYTLARTIHILAIVAWIGGVAFVTTVLMPAILLTSQGEDHARAGKGTANIENARGFIKADRPIAAHDTKQGLAVDPDFSSDLVLGLVRRLDCMGKNVREAGVGFASEWRGLANPKPCDTSGLDANEAFAKAHGFNGTPVIVRPSDGAILEGYRPASMLREFLKPAKAAAIAPAKKG